MMRSPFPLLVVVLMPLICATAAGERTPSSKQAVLKAVELASGKGFFRHSVEIAVSRDNGKVVVLFRRPTSDIIESEGRKPTKDIWRAIFQGEEVRTEVLDEAASKPKFDPDYSRQNDQKFARAVSAALSHLWKAKNFNRKEFAVDVFEAEDHDVVLISHIPYTPDAQAMVYVFPNGRVERVPFIR